MADGAERRSIPPDAQIVRRRFTVRGIVQGVGFRPFVYRLASRDQLAGFVVNDTTGVVIEVEGQACVLDRFAAALVADRPPLALISELVIDEITTAGSDRFVIRASEHGQGAPATIPIDSAPCADCERELADPTNRRFGHPFINCTNCGPRFTIVAGLPYDRASTSMAGFSMCAACRREYDDPTDRRFHAEPICCRDCGPQLSCTNAAGAPVTGQLPTPLSPGMDPALAHAANAVLDGQIVAVKGVGGYHLVVRADDDTAVRRLRERKQREEKPLAVLVTDLDAARQLAYVGTTEAAALEAIERPIVLLPRRADAGLAPTIAPAFDQIGLLLPPSPLHLLLARAVGLPLVLTSGNLTDEPIAITDEDGLARLGTIADLFLTHDRPILRRADDSVMTVSAGRALLIRRARGFAPRPISLESSGPSVLAVGAALKNTICITRDAEAFVSPHLGDLQNLAAFEAFREMVDSLLQLLGVEPEVVVHDLHPDYLSTKFAQSFDGVETLGVQHHHAHVAACLAEHQMTDRVVGVAFDGVGYGPDGGLWGGEFLIADLSGFERVGCLAPVPLPGGTAALRQPWRMALAHLRAAYGDAVPHDLDVITRNAHRWEAVAEVAGRASLSPPTHGVGRLFDAVAAIVGLRDEVSFEGQAAMLLEQSARRGGPADPYEADVSATSHGLCLDAAPLIRAVADDLRRGVVVEHIAARFHAGLAAATAIMVDTIGRARQDVDTVALTGGVFQNRILLDLCRAELRVRGWRVIVPAQVPPGDGGISFGQAAVGRVLVAGRAMRP